jgi:hypothetical protein
MEDCDDTLRFDKWKKEGSRTKTQCNQQQIMRQHTNSTMQIIERKCEAQNGSKIRSNLKSNMVSWTVGDEKHSINSPINVEI